MVRARTFISHHGLCGQPAGLGGVARFRPLPPHAGHLTRINAMPSDLPLMSTGRAMYPVPPQRRQLFGFTLPPQLQGVFHQFWWAAQESEFCYENRTRLGAAFFDRVFFRSLLSQGRFQVLLEVLAVAKSLRPSWPRGAKSSGGVA